MAIAFNAGIRGNTDGVVIDIGINDRTLKIFSEVKNQMINANLLCDAPSIIHIADTATTRVTLSTPQAHRDTNDFVTLLEQQCSSDRRINASGHGY